MLEAVAVWANWLKGLTAQSYEKRMSGGIWLASPLHIQEFGKNGRMRWGLRKLKRENKKQGRSNVVRRKTLKEGFQQSGKYVYLGEIDTTKAGTRRGGISLD